MNPVKKTYKDYLRLLYKQNKGLQPNGREGTGLAGVSGLD